MDVLTSETSITADPDPAAEREAVERLQRDAGKGEAQAMAALGERLLSGRGIAASPFEGATMLVEASNKGDAAAAARIAVLCAAGAATPQSWPHAFDYLQLAAERGHALARGQLMLLADVAGAGELTANARNGGADAPDIWKRLRQAVDVKPWLSPPPMKILRQSPLLATVDEFASRPLCEWLIARARPNLRRARVYDGERPGARLEGSRNNSAAEFDIIASDVISVLVRERMSAATKVPSRSMEDTQVLHYATGQEFRRHFDFLDPELPAHADDLAKSGQRVLTFLIYLNDGFDGGETEFPLIDLKYKGHTGGAICFRNVEQDGKPDRRTLHAGLPPSRGEKWLLSQWIRGSMK